MLVYINDNPTLWWLYGREIYPGFILFKHNNFPENTVEMS